VTVFIDTAIIMYAGGAEHRLRAPCQRLLEHVADGRLEAVTSELVEAHPALAARDLVHVATCLQEGIRDIVSPDRGFDSVPGIRWIDPATSTRF
jgi:predicted nucleic acid-binding protein